MDNSRSFEEGRVPGCMLEKELATPDCDPLTGPAPRLVAASAMVIPPEPDQLAALRTEVAGLRGRLEALGQALGVR